MAAQINFAGEVQRYDFTPISPTSITSPTNIKSRGGIDHNDPNLRFQKPPGSRVEKRMPRNHPSLKQHYELDDDDSVSHPAEINSNNTGTTDDAEDKIWGNHSIEPTGSFDKGNSLWARCNCACDPAFLLTICLLLGMCLGGGIAVALHLTQKNGSSDTLPTSIPTIAPSLEPSKAPTIAPTVPQPTIDWEDGRPVILSSTCMSGNFTRPMSPKEMQVFETAFESLLTSDYYSIEDVESRVTEATFAESCGGERRRRSLQEQSPATSGSVMLVGQELRYSNTTDMDLTPILDDPSINGVLLSIMQTISPESDSLFDDVESMETNSIQASRSPTTPPSPAPTSALTTPKPINLRPTTPQPQPTPPPTKKPTPRPNPPNPTLRPTRTPTQSPTPFECSDTTQYPEAVVLEPDTRLIEGEYVYSPNQEYSVGLKNGDFVLWRYDKTILSAGLTEADRLYMQGDGNLVARDWTLKHLWSSSTWGNPGAKFVIHDGGRIAVIATDDRVLWSQWPTCPDFFKK